MIKSYIPNFITLINLFCGCLAIVFAFSGKLEWVAPAIFVGVVADFMDGFVARWLGVPSEMGKQLDSLSDMATFGVVPGVILFQLLLLSYGIDSINWENAQVIYCLPAFIITLFSALRLGKFNIDDRQTDGFIGLPTPSATLFVVSILLTALYGSEYLQNLILNPWVLYSITIGLSYLLVAEIPMFAMKSKNYGWQANKLKYILLILNIALLIIFKYLGLALGVINYVIFSIINNYLKK